MKLFSKSKDSADLVYISFRDIGLIIKKVKSEVCGERGQLKDDDSVGDYTNQVV